MLFFLVLLELVQRLMPQLLPKPVPRLGLQPRLELMLMLELLPGLGPIIIEINRVEPQPELVILLKVVIQQELPVIRQVEPGQHQLVKLERHQQVVQLLQPIDLLMLVLRRQPAHQQQQLKSTHPHQRKAFDQSEGGILH